jgi:hypothetical protein
VSRNSCVAQCSSNQQMRMCRAVLFSGTLLHSKRCTPSLNVCKLLTPTGLPYLLTCLLSS